MFYLFSVNNYAAYWQPADTSYLFKIDVYACWCLRSTHNFFMTQVNKRTQYLYSRLPARLYLRQLSSHVIWLSREAGIDTTLTWHVRFGTAWTPGVWSVTVDWPGVKFMALNPQPLRTQVNKDRVTRFMNGCTCRLRAGCTGAKGIHVTLLQSSDAETKRTSIKPSARVTWIP